MDRKHCIIAGSSVFEKLIRLDTEALSRLVCIKYSEPSQATPLTFTKSENDKNNMEIFFMVILECT